MTLVGIFEHILDGFDFSSDKVNNLLIKAEDTIYTVMYTVIDKTLDIFSDK